jgi:hypothetical protein
MTTQSINEIIDRLQAAMDSLHKNGKVEPAYRAGFTCALANIEEYLSTQEEDSKQ